MGGRRRRDGPRNGRCRARLGAIDPPKARLWTCSIFAPSPRWANRSGSQVVPEVSCGIRRMREAPGGRSPRITVADPRSSLSRPPRTASPWARWAGFSGPPTAERPGSGAKALIVACPDGDRGERPQEISYSLLAALAGDQGYRSVVVLPSKARSSRRRRRNAESRSPHSMQRLRSVRTPP